MPRVTEIELVPEPDERVMWECTPGQFVYAQRQEVDYIFSVMEEYDAIPFVWRLSRGYLFALLPRRLWTAGEGKQ